MQLVIRSDGGEDLLLDRSWSQLWSPIQNKSAWLSSADSPEQVGQTYLNPAQNTGVEDIDPCIDSVPHKLDGLLNESVDEGRSGFGDNNTVRGGLGNFGDHDRPFSSVSKVEVPVSFEAFVLVSDCHHEKSIEGSNGPERLERIGTSDIRIQHKERAIILPQNILRQRQRPRSPKGLGLDREIDGDPVLLFSLLEHGDHDLGTVVDGENDVFHACLDEGLEQIGG